jgi:hypothetical protein
MNGKREVSRDSVLAAIAAGAKSVTAIGLAHGYGKPVSGAVTARIRGLVPDVADRIAGKVAEPKPAVQVEQRKEYRGEVYGKVFAEAVRVGAEQGEQPRKAVVAVVSRKTGLAETQVSFALQVFTTPKHQSNMGRSRNAATRRGHVLLVASEAEG